MKPKGRHPEKALSAVRVKGTLEPGRYADGNGLYLVVDPSGARRWVLRTVVQGKRRDLGLGSYLLVCLAEARESASKLRRIARSGGDPLAERRRARLAIPTFAAAARITHSEHAPAWRNSKHKAQWLSTLAQYAFPAIGDRRVDQIETSEILKLLSPIWLTKPETARRVKQRIKTVLDWAKAAAHRSGENPVDGVTNGLPKQPDRKQHFKALPYSEIGNFIESLREAPVGEIVRLAMEFLILTAARTNEVIGATWQEISLERRIWTIPAERMKARREHRVPLSPRCVEILNRASQLSATSNYLFPGRSESKPMSNMALLMLLRRMGIGATAHGFRSAFRDWAAEKTNFPREVCEMALAHTVKDRAEAAYRRGDLFDKRRKLIDAWANYALSSKGEIVRLQPREVRPFAR
jgi:integrase